MVKPHLDHLFGAGLVRTVDNFGATGETPSQDFSNLAPPLDIGRRLEREEADREIMLSRATVKLRKVPQTSEVLFNQNRAGKPSPLAHEPRRPRRRGAPRFHVDGQRAIGSSASAGRRKAGTTVERDYRFDDTRRSIYTPIFRNKLLELFEVFDFADPNISMGRRNTAPWRRRRCTS